MAFENKQEKEKLDIFVNAFRKTGMWAMIKFDYEKFRIKTEEEIEDCINSVRMDLILSNIQISN